MKFVFVKNKMLLEKLEYERYINCYTSFTADLNSNWSQFNRTIHLYDIFRQICILSHQMDNHKSVIHHVLYFHILFLKNSFKKIHPYEVYPF